MEACLQTRPWDAGVARNGRFRRIGLVEDTQCVVLLGALVLIANRPYTLLATLPTNHKLMAIDPASAGPESRALAVKWGSLHIVRTELGLSGNVLFFCGPR